MTCYVHLPCITGPESVCLDWREICDGKIDCMHNSIDEQFCFELEMNECADDEYRCRNGLCIPGTFVGDNALNPDCIDRSDEPYIGIYPQRCIGDPSFRCEEHMCQYPRENLCDDG
ncbi:unnamed protein product, partial [Rotaria sp. Silwood2]